MNRNEYTISINEEHLGDATTQQAQRMVELLNERGWDVRYGSDMLTGDALEWYEGIVDEFESDFDELLDIISADDNRAALESALDDTNDRDPLDDLIDEVAKIEEERFRAVDGVREEIDRALSYGPDLDLVVTAAEVANEYGITTATVRQTIARGAIVARKSGSTWLMLRADAEAFWG